jgi:hypothetical protein
MSLTNRNKPVNELNPILLIKNSTKMNKIILVIAMLITTSALHGQGKIESMFQKYSGIEGVTNLQISGSMLKMLANMNGGDEELNKVASSISSILILHVPENMVELKGLNFFSEFEQGFPAENYTELIRVNDSDQQIKILFQEKAGIVEELIMIVGGSIDNTLIHIKGQMDMANLSSLSGMGVPGMDQFFILQE